MYIIIKAEKKDSMKKIKTSQSEKKTYYIQSIRMAIVFSPESMKATDTGVIFLKHKKKKKNSGNRYSISSKYISNEYEIQNSQTTNSWNDRRDFFR